MSWDSDTAQTRIRHTQDRLAIGCHLILRPPPRSDTSWKILEDRWSCRCQDIGVERCRRWRGWFR